MTTATISKRFDFSASHSLEGLAEEHPCSRLHGHNYSVTVEITGETDDIGFVIDYRALSPFKDWLDEVVEHRHLNDLVEWNPTAENLAHWLGEEVHALLWATSPEAMRRVTTIRVSVSETPKTTATVTRRPDAFDAADHTAGDQELSPFLLDADRYRWGTAGTGDEHLDLHIFDTDEEDTP